jgi:tetratricopeptide (TPR) repeat protein
MGTLSAAEIEAHLADRFAFLAYRRRAADPRHQALRAAIDWSYDLLSPAERGVLNELSVFAGSFGRGELAQVCSADDAAVLEMVDRLAGKSLVAAEPAAVGTRYRLLETVREYAADRLAETGDADATRRRHALTFLDLIERERRVAILSREHDNFRAALDWSLTAGDRIGPRMACALGNFWLAQGLLAEGKGWLERALTQPVADERLRADLQRLLGTLLYEAGDLKRAEAVLQEGLEVATATGALSLQARIRVQLADIHNLWGASMTEALKECDAATAVLDAEGDLEGLAEAWLLAGKVRMDRGEWPANRQALERAIDYAGRSGNHRARMQASHWLAVTYVWLPVRADDAVARVQQLLQAADGEPWAEAYLLLPLSMLNAYVGRLAEARAALTRSRSIFAGFGAKLALAFTTIPAGHIELAAGDAAAAERYSRQGYEAFRAMAERGAYANLAALLAEALYGQHRFREAEELTEQAQAAAAPDDVDALATCWIVRAKLLAQRGELEAARQLADDTQALISPTSWAVHRAKVLVARAEVSRLGGARDQAATSLQAALQIYEDRGATQLAAQIRAALIGLAPAAGSPA